MEVSLEAFIEIGRSTKEAMEAAAGVDLRPQLACARDGRLVAVATFDGPAEDVYTQLYTVVCAFRCTAAAFTSEAWSKTFQPPPDLDVSDEAAVQAFVDSVGYQRGDLAKSLESQECLSVTYARFPSVLESATVVFSRRDDGSLEWAEPVVTGRTGPPAIGLVADVLRASLKEAALRRTTGQAPEDATVAYWLQSAVGMEVTLL